MRQLMDNDEFNYRFKSRNRPIEDSPQWDHFLEEFALRYPALDSYRNSFFLLENGLGDQVCILGLLSAFRKHYKPKNIIVIASEKARELASVYDCYDKILFFKDIKVFNNVSNGRVFNVLHRPSKSYSFYGKLGPIYNTFCIPYLDQYRVGLCLPLVSSFEGPRAPSIVEDSKIIQYKNAVILFPYSNTWKSPSIEFWSSLSVRLRQEGYDVYTNVINKVASGKSRQDSTNKGIHDPIPGTKVLKCGIRELLCIAEVAKAAIVNVSGPAFLLSHSKCQKIILHDDICTKKNSVRSSGSSGIGPTLFEIESLRESFPDSDFSEIILTFGNSGLWSESINTILLNLR